MVGTPGHSTHTVKYSDGRTVTYHAIVTNHANITIDNIESAHIGNASGSPYGTNGTFFYTSSATPPSGYAIGNVYRIAINNGAQVKNKGLVNRLNATANGDCGTLGWYKKPVSGASYFCEDITQISDLGTTNSNIQWAIGGVNLYLNDSGMTKSQFDRKVNTQFSSSTSTVKTARTAIFYRSSGAPNDIVLLAAFGSSGTGKVGSSNGPTPWELRSFIIDTFKNGSLVPAGSICEGIMLDGGGSTQMAYKFGNNRQCVQADYRPVQIMIKTPM